MSGAIVAAQRAEAYDVFNGDADGICALHQLRLACPCDATLVTGVKRDIALLQRVPAKTDVTVTALDISLDANVQPLRQILGAGGRVDYFDHHSARQAFRHPNLRLFWDDAPDVCTSILVDRHLHGRFRKWAVTAAFGDNLSAVAYVLASSESMSARDTNALERLGTLFNYNAYGEQVEDLHVMPDTLYRSLQGIVDPIDFIFASPYYPMLDDGYRSDTARMGALAPDWCCHEGAIYILPCAPWARRISGVFANHLVRQGQDRSFAVLTESHDGSFVASVRSGHPEHFSANVFCEQFPTGGGRKAAAGINVLQAGELDRFAKAFVDYFCTGVKAINGVVRAS
jgi:hypothetical protein